MRKEDDMSDQHGRTAKAKVDEQSVQVTVFTATFNRRHTLERTYRSLQKQTFKDFEWLIIDDGSTDDTETLISEWLKEENSFPIIYHWKPNGGLHTAHNAAISLARGEYFTTLDSDDWYDPEALMLLTNQWNSLPASKKLEISNIEGLCRHADGTLIGAFFPADVYESDNFSIRKHKWPMDTLGMYRLDVLKEFPFPEGYEGGFVEAALVWHRIADKYKTLFLNKTVGYKEYLPVGITHRSLTAKFRKSAAKVLYHREFSRIKSAGMIERLKSRINVFRYSYHNKLSIAQQLHEEPFILSWISFAILGYLIYVKDRVAIYRERKTKKAWRYVKRKYRRTIP
jgi:glycosyltransferase involved in cell wall biosynthesis